MFIAVDGTGALSNEQYKKDQENSFVHQLFKESRDHRFYYRGPSLAGLETRFIAEAVARRASEALKKGDRNIRMAGWSRGGAAIIVAARMLEPELAKAGLKIDCLLLFDAVGRDVLTSSDQIPASVRSAYHALRDPRVESRGYFGNVGTSAASSVHFEYKHFLVTHAALGGEPWTGDKPDGADTTWHRPPESKEDADHRRKMGRPPLKSGDFVAPLGMTKTIDEDGSRQVRRWMWERARRHHIVP